MDKHGVLEQLWKTLHVDKCLQKVKDIESFRDFITLVHKFRYNVLLTLYQ